MMCILYLLFLFVKQKTAYEMRISDWSSDVCSSDLLLAGVVQVLGPFLRMDHRALETLDAGKVGRVAAFVGIVAAAEEQDVDRKSVVSGKSVSVRVDIGGRRLIKIQEVKTTAGVA